MLRIRLTRVGKKNSPAYRVVIADKRRAVKRKFIEIIGHYNPTLTPKQIVIDKERALFWIGNGAQPSLTVNNLMCDLDILNKKDKIKKIFGKKLSKKATKEGAGETAPTLQSESRHKVVGKVAVEEAQETPAEEKSNTEKVVETESKVETENAASAENEAETPAKVESDKEAPEETK